MTIQLEKANHFIGEADHLLVVSHLHPDGDAVSSTLAAAQMFRLLGKRVTMVNESPIPKKFTFLSGVEEILQPERVMNKFRYVVALDCADAERMGNSRELFAGDVKILNIDHHPTNDHFGTVNVVEPGAAATVEILFQWIENNKIPWNKSLATAIYTGLLTDTGGFRYSNTSSRVLRQAAHLIEIGIPAHIIADTVLETTTIEQLQILQTALQSLQRTKDGLIAWMSLRLQDLQRIRAANDDLDGIVNYARNILGVDVGILFRETEQQTVKVSFRSRSRVDVGSVAKSLGGGGHARAAGCTFQGTLEEAQRQILSRVQAELERDGK
ncbi:bifunctional oligoribonuclease/PAP phosphatase NrnA [Paenactinomyces guangxiensis]|uniref:Bifunctional oligoribonuclease/PAP phosphatase NrnA n=1 Tax=Paenactinomyces guangxiensis TaxID=1490290 RepID=A0A7W2A878_9BACL|nr:bifunctional oligoribonuclease/PAP phosphatase NrnA [Paenactinomyces guangxiensis]MBA4494375.1 bifunctional oligoribonuclease/PAP phosphatase NrnA [Paenactinomyces guangxiensis]MBH8591570.1 bifunctional oligoribonuclease/PAP phosphatase NrnA [Paenactinomyces guangxiensis]